MAEWGGAAESDLKETGAEALPDGRSGVRFRGWHIESCRRPILSSLALQGYAILYLQSLADCPSISPEILDVPEILTFESKNGLFLGVNMIIMFALVPGLDGGGFGIFSKFFCRSIFIGIIPGIERLKLVAIRTRSDPKKCLKMVTLASKILYVKKWQKFRYFRDFLKV